MGVYTDQYFLRASVVKIFILLTETSANSLRPAGLFAAKAAPTKLKNLCVFVPLW